METTNSVSPIAGRIIAKLGGVAKTSALTGKAEPTIYKWRQPKEAGGTGGLIPVDAQQVLMAAALRGECSLAPEDFFDLPE